MLDIRIHGRPEQKDTIRKLYHSEHNQMALFADMGLGKTMMMLHYIAIAKKKGKIKGPVLLICPLLVMYNVWAQEAYKWKDTRDLTFIKLHGNHKDRLIRGDADIFLLNFEGIPWFIKALKKNFTKFPFSTLVVDESTKMKDPTTKRFKEFKPAIPFFKYRYILTGTPIPNGIIDIWGQWFLLAPGTNKFMGNSFPKWCRQNFHNYSKDYRFPMWSPHPETRGLVQKAIRDRTIRLSSKNLVTLPKYIPLETYIPMTKDIQVKWRNMKRDEAYIDGDTIIEIDSDIVMQQKRRQFTQGAMYVGPYSDEYVRIHDLKLHMLKERLDQTQGNCLITVHYRFEVEILAKEFPGVPFIVSDQLAHLKGVVKSKDTPRVLADWNAGKLKHLFVNPASISHGLNLQSGGNYLFMYSIPESTDAYAQTIGRLVRPGQPNTVFCDHLILEGSWDDQVVRKHLSRFRTQEDFLNYFEANK